MRRRPEEPGDIDWSRFDWNDLIRLRRRTGGPSRRSVGFFIFVLILFLIPVVIGPLISFWTDVLWFRSIGLESVFLRIHALPVHGRATSTGAKLEVYIGGEDAHLGGDGPEPTDDDGVA